MGLQLVVLLGVFGIVLGQSSEDPCDPVNHYELNDLWRSTGYTTGIHEKPHCDNHLQRGWYRFTSKAGGTIPTSPPPKLSCGTVTPVWMNGTLPAVDAGMKLSYLCSDMHGVGDPCGKKVETMVKNCEGFYVYYLQALPTCYIAYCAGDKSPCPAGTWSDDGMPPCREAYPTMESAPDLSDPIIASDGKSFHFTCTINFKQQDPMQRFEVSWTFDGQEDPNIPRLIVSDPQRVVTLDGARLQGHINTNIGCSVRTFFVDINNGHHGGFSPVEHSNTYYAGIEVNTNGPGRLSVSEASLSTNISITSTIPVLCNHNVSCCIMFHLDVDATSELSVQNNCDWDLCTKDWNPRTHSATIQVPVVANKDLIDDGNQNLQIAFDPLLPTGGGEYMNVFLGHTPDPLPVTTVDGKPYHCHIWGDPHINGFEEHKMYHNFHGSGDFTMCKVEEENFEVQIRTWGKPNSRRRPVQWICGVVVREGNDIIRINQCDQIWNFWMTSPTVEIAGKLRQSTVVQRSNNGRVISVYLPSGTEVKVVAEPAGMTVTLITSGVYADRCRGQCGTNDGNPTNEFTHPSGQVDPPCKRTDGHWDCRPHEFIDSWRPSSFQSLFEHIPAPVNQTDELQYCACRDADTTHNHAYAKCGVRQDLPAAGTLCHGCPDITHTLGLGLDPFAGMALTWDRRRRATRNVNDQYTDDDVVDVTYRADNGQVDNINLTWPSENGMTEAQANVSCLIAVQKSPLYSACKDNHAIIENLIAACTLDILLMGDNDSVPSIMHVFTSMCQANLKMDPHNYITNAEGKNVLQPQFVTTICQAGCEEHGHCDSTGTCVCEAGYEGAACHLRAGQGVNLISVRGGTLCDRAVRPCRTVYIDADNLDLSKQLGCKVIALGASGSPLGAPVQTDALMLSAHRISCQLPASNDSVIKYSIAASNDGHLFGNSLQVTVYDSLCVACDDHGCTNKNTVCNIAGQCFTNGQHHVTDSQLVCDVTMSTTDWTRLGGPAPTLTGPDADHLYNCHFQITDFSNATITWLVDGVIASSEPISTGAKKAWISAHDLSNTGELQCQINVNGTKSTSSSLIIA